MNNEQALQLLNDLGEDADSVARSLKAQDIKGDHRCYTCPIAQLLLKNGAHYTMVGSMIRVYDDAAKKWADDFKPPASVDSFIDSFDQGAYPELETA